MKWGKTLLHSLSIYAPNEKVVIYAVNFSNSDFDELNSIHKRLTIHNKIVPFISNKFKRHYMANRKASIFLDAIQRYNSIYFVLLDADMLLIQPINRLIDECIGKRAGLVYRSSEKGNHMKFNSSIIVINKNMKGEKLIFEWKKSMNSNLLLKTVNNKLSIIDYIRNKNSLYSIPLRVRKGSWFWDQITLYDAINKLNFEFKNLNTDVFLNSNFDENAVCWSAHSGNKQIAIQNFQNKIKRIKKSPNI